MKWDYDADDRDEFAKMCRSLIVEGLTFEVSFDNDVYTITLTGGY